jgi:uncharacterized MnhB-related membrane protein
MLPMLLVISFIFCAVQVIRQSRLMASALWLAVTSALLALFLYSMGAHEVAVIELSVGAGLVTVLFVFVISISDETPTTVRSVVHPGFALVLVVLVTLALFQLIDLDQTVNQIVPESPFALVFWQSRSLDIILQLLIIFTGTLGILWLLKTPEQGPEQNAFESYLQSLGPEQPLENQPEIEETVL